METVGRGERKKDFCKASDHLMLKGGTSLTVGEYKLSDQDLDLWSEPLSITHIPVWNNFLSPGDPVFLVSPERIKNACVFSLLLFDAIL